MEYVGLTVRGKRLHALLCTHDKSTLPRDVWMVLNVCSVKMIDINKKKELRLGPSLKKILNKIKLDLDKYTSTNSKNRF